MSYFADVPEVCDERGAQSGITRKSGSTDFCESWSACAHPRIRELRCIMHAREGVSACELLAVHAACCRYMIAQYKSSYIFADTSIPVYCHIDSRACIQHFLTPTWARGGCWGVMCVFASLWCSCVFLAHRYPLILFFPYLGASRLTQGIYRALCACVCSCASVSCHTRSFTRISRQSHTRPCVYVHYFVHVRVSLSLSLYQLLHREQKFDLGVGVLRKSDNSSHEFATVLEAGKVVLCVAHTCPSIYGSMHALYCVQCLIRIAYAIYMRSKLPPPHTDNIPSSCHAEHPPPLTHTGYRA